MFAAVSTYRTRFGTWRNNCVKAGFSTGKPVRFGTISAVKNSEFFIGFGYKYGTLINITNKVFLNAKENVQ
jgi:hypothetical protein